MLFAELLFVELLFVVLSLTVEFVISMHCFRVVL